MYFAWDSRLERLTNEAVRRFYLDRYGLREHDLTGVRSVVGWLRGAALRDVAVRTLTIERTSPLQPADEAYLLEAIFRDTWGERLRPYLPPRVCGTDGQLRSEGFTVCTAPSGLSLSAVFHAVDRQHMKPA